MRSALLGLHEPVRPLAVPPLGDERVAARAPPASPARQVVANRAMAAAKRDYYDVLGVERGCEEKEIKAAYAPRTLSCELRLCRLGRLQAAR